MGLFEVVEKAVKKTVEVAKDGAHKLDEAAKATIPGYAGAREFASRLANGDLGRQAVPMPEVIAKVVAGNSGQWYQGAQQAQKLATTHDLISSRINEISAGLEAAWTGRSADAAQARIKPFANVIATAAQSFTENSTNLTGLAHGFDSVQAAFRNNPLPPRPDKGFLDVATPWDTDTEKKIAEYNALVKQHLSRYKSYNAQATAAASQLRLFYGQVDPFGDIKITVTGGGGTAPVGSSAGSRSALSDGASRVGGPSEVSNPQAGVPGAEISGPGVGTPGSRVGDAPLDGTTQAAGFVPPAATGTGTGTPLMAGSGGGGTASFGPGVGAVAGLVGGGAGSRVGGPGKGVGAGVPGTPGGARGNAGVAGGGRGGTSGTSGMAGVPGAGRGRGADDEEHRRKYGENDDSMFRLEGDEAGQVMIDPNTGLPVAPPTIGG
jgi:hypothetical protein